MCKLVFISGRTNIGARLYFYINMWFFSQGDVCQGHPPYRENPKKYMALYFWKVLLPPANEVWGKVIFLHLFVILFTGGEYLGRYNPWDQVPPQDQVHSLPTQTRNTPTPPGPATHPSAHILEDKVNARAVHTLLKCNLVLVYLW